MRMLIIAGTILVGVGLILLFLGQKEGPAPEVPDRAAEPKQGMAPVGRADTVLQPDSPEDQGARGTGDPGSTPSLAQAPSEKDGVLDVEVVAGERPVPDASVRLYWRGARDPSLGGVSWRLASVGTTDAQGHAQLPSRPGAYQVAVRAQGYASLLRDVVRPYGEARTSLRLTLQQGQSLTGRTVVKGTEETLPLVELVLMAHGHKLDRLQRAEAPAEERVYASSDEQGNFRVDGLAPGEYQLEARAPGHAQAVLRSVMVPAAGPLTVALQVAGVIEGFVVDAQGAPAAGVEVQVSGRVAQVATTGQGGGFSMEVEAGSYTVSARRGEEAGSLDKLVNVGAGKTVRDVRVQLGQGAALEGRVVARSDGAPIPGASVNVSPQGKNGDSGRTVTDGTGHFSVGGLAPGGYDLVVSAPGFSPESKRRLVVAAGERFPLEIQLSATGTVEGQVKDEDGKPVQGVQITGGIIWGGSLGNTSAEARTDAEGNYRIEGLARGTMVLTASRDGITLSERKRVDVMVGGTTRVDFILKGAGIVEGMVRAATGSLSTEFLSVAAAQMEGERVRFDSAATPVTELDATGHFRMGLPVGRYFMQVMSQEREGVRGFGKGVKVQVEAGKTVQVELTWERGPRDSGGLQGIVLEPDGTPSQNARVTLSNESGQPLGVPATTDGEGRFSLPMWGNAGQGPMGVSAVNGGRCGELEGVKPGEQALVVKLRLGASVRGQVVHASGRTPVKGFSLTAQTSGLRGRSWSGERSEFPGNRFELREVPCEPYKLVARTKEGAEGEVQVSPNEGAMAEVEISVAHMAGMRGRVLDLATKAPIPALVNITREPVMNGTTEAGEDGLFNWTEAPPGEYTLTVRATSMTPAESRQVTLVEGQVLDVGDILLSTPSSFPGPSGTVVKEESGQLVISKLLADSLAAKAGLLVGDILLEVDGAPLTRPYAVLEWLQGQPGISVVIKVRRAGAEQSIPFPRGSP